MASPTLPRPPFSGLSKSNKNSPLVDPLWTPCGLFVEPLWNPCGTLVEPLWIPRGPLVDPFLLRIFQIVVHFR